MNAKIWCVLGMAAALSMAAQAQDGGMEGGKPGRPPRRGVPRPEGQMMRPDRGEMLKKFDKDGDGQLSEEEREAMREARKGEMEARRAEMLKKYDKDGDGKLSMEEREAMREDMPPRGMRPPRPERDGNPPPPPPEE